MELSFIVIDDSELDCFIARKIIEHTDDRLTVKTYQDARLAFEIIKNNKPEHTTIVLLDLQMPLMSGFEFVEEFEQLAPETTNNYMMVILSSTRNNNDIYRILTYPAVHSILEKPLTREKLFALIQQVQAGN